METLNPVNTELYSHLASLRDQLAAFRTMPCRLVHEEVLGFMGESFTADGTAQLHAKRRGFCDKNLRQVTLGCAHTPANDRFARVADAVFATGICDGGEPPSVTINGIVMQVYLLDDQKGSLEKQLAVLRSKKAAAENIHAVETAIADVQTRHTTAIGKLEQIRQSLIAKIDGIHKDFS